MAEHSDMSLESADAYRLKAADELRELSREIHDHVAHLILSVLTDLELFKGGDMNDADARRYLSRAERSTLEALDYTRALAERLRFMAGHAERPECSSTVNPSRSEGKLARSAGHDAKRAEDSPDVHNELLLVLREAVHNAVTHAWARHVAIDVRMDDSWISAVIEDDGRGFEPDRLPPEKSVGLSSMSERTARVGGRFEIMSRPHRGTRVTIGMPHGEDE